MNSFKTDLRKYKRYKQELELLYLNRNKKYYKWTLRKVAEFAIKPFIMSHDLLDCNFLLIKTF